MNGYAYDDWTLPLATQVMLEAFRSIVEGEDDEHEVPLGRLLAELADEIGLDSAYIDREAISTAGELRRNTRLAMAELASNTGSEPRT